MGKDKAKSKGKKGKHMKQMVTKQKGIGKAKPKKKWRSKEAQKAKKNEVVVKQVVSEVKKSKNGVVKLGTSGIQKSKNEVVKQGASGVEKSKDDVLKQGASGVKKRVNKKDSLRDKMMKRLNAARFRQLNEELDSVANDDPKEAFGSTSETFQKYHEAYRERKDQWDVDPLDVIISWIQKNLPATAVIADFGCGEAKLAASVPNTVHSFDLFALNERVTACDMSKCPLKDGSVDVAVYCLSLMGINVGKFVLEANRVLKKRGILKIAEVASRFQDTNPTVFIKKMKKFGFTPVSVDKEDAEKQNNSQSSDIFYMFEFRKIRGVNEMNGKPPALKLNPSVYKKR